MTKLKRSIIQRGKSSPWRWLLTTSSSCPKMTHRMKRANRFLGFMERKIHVEVKDSPNEGWKTFEKFTRRSKCWSLYILNKTERNYFLKYDLKTLTGILSKFQMNIRLKKFKLDLKRIYVEKANGKLRPIGAPSLDSKMIYATVNEFLLIYMEPKLGDFQYGFRPNKGLEKAQLEVVKNIRTGKKVFEFDLSGFFNNLNAEVLCREIKKTLPDLGDWIRFTNRFTIPKLKDIKECDNEIQFLESVGGIEKWGKSGFTQGANWSPIISLYALVVAKYESIEGLLMYADDGLVFRDKEEDIIGLDSRKWGIRVNSDKNLGWCTQFKFLGVEYDINKWTAKVENRIVSLDDEENLRKLFKFSKYNDSPKESRYTVWYGKEWAWKSIDQGIITLLSEGSYPVVCSTGVVWRNINTARTEANNILWETLSNLGQWKRSQRTKISPSERDSVEGNKLFNIHASISRNVVVQQRVA